MTWSSTATRGRTGPRRPLGEPGGFGSLALSIPLGFRTGRPFSPLSRAISSRWAATVCSSAATLPSSSTTRAFSSVGESASRSPGEAILPGNQRSTGQESEKRAATSFAAGTSAQAKPLIRLGPELCAEIRISHRLLNRISEALVEGIAEAPDRADGVGAAALVESFPQAAHENIDRALIYVGVLTPDIGEKLLSGEHAPRRLHQVFEKAELGRAKMDLLTGGSDASCPTAKFEVAGAQRRAYGVPGRPAQGGSHAGHQFGDGEGLHHVVVRAGGEAPDAVELLTPRREHDDRQVLCFGARPEPTAEFDA